MIEMFLVNRSGGDHKLDVEGDLMELEKFITHYKTENSITLLEEKHIIDPDSTLPYMLDPWNQKYLYFFSDGEILILTKGPDRKLNTSDDSFRVMKR